MTATLRSVRTWNCHVLRAAVSVFGVSCGGWRGRTWRGFRLPFTTYALRQHANASLNLNPSLFVVTLAA